MNFRGLIRLEGGHDGLVSKLFGGHDNDSGVSLSLSAEPTTPHL